MTFPFWYVIVFDFLLLAVLAFAALGAGTRRAVLKPGENPLESPERWEQSKELRFKRLIFIGRVWLMIAAPLTLGAWLYLNFRIVSAAPLEPIQLTATVAALTPSGTPTNPASPTPTLTSTPYASATPRITFTPSATATQPATPTAQIVYRSNTVVQTQIVKVEVTRNVFTVITTTPQPTYTAYPTYTPWVIYLEVTPTYTASPTATEPPTQEPTPTETETQAP